MVHLYCGESEVLGPIPRPWDASRALNMLDSLIQDTGESLPWINEACLVDTRSVIRCAVRLPAKGQFHAESLGDGSQGDSGSRIAGRMLRSSASMDDHSTRCEPPRVRIV